MEHKVESDRIIFDRRPQNSIEERLNWCRLPHGSSLTRLKLQPWEHIQAHGDDISNYFYHLKLEPAARHRSAFGRVISGNDAVQLGGGSG